ncbi:MAG: TRAP-type C4-dicarboxylate transport system permease small subunit [Sulfitobacter sp.]|jgi:TRAP-type C4-dicarboxylate transport system permease small subunit
MGVLLGLLRPLQALLDVVLSVGKAISVFAIGMMVVCILIQVFFRYVLGNALTWPDEAARFCMLWMTGFMAPYAYRRGGFVAIDMVLLALPRAIGSALAMVLLGVAGLVLFVAVQIGYGEITGFGSRFATASLYLPSLVDGSVVWERMPRYYMFLSMFVGVCLLLAVNFELILRSVVTLLGGADHLRPIPGEAMIEAE